MHGRQPAQQLLARLAKTMRRDKETIATNWTEPNEKPTDGHTSPTRQCPPTTTFVPMPNLVRVCVCLATRLCLLCFSLSPLCCSFSLSLFVGQLIDIELSRNMVTLSLFPLSLNHTYLSLSQFHLQLVPIPLFDVLIS